MSWLVVLCTETLSVKGGKWFDSFSYCLKIYIIFNVCSDLHECQIIRFLPKKHLLVNINRTGFVSVSFYRTFLGFGSLYQFLWTEAISWDSPLKSNVQQENVKTRKKQKTLKRERNRKCETRKKQKTLEDTKKRNVFEAEMF